MGWFVSCNETGAAAEAVGVSTIPQRLAITAERHGSRVAIEDPTGSLTYAELRRRSLLAARALLAMDIGPGDRVAIWAPNGADWIIAALGIHTVGAILVPVSTRLKGAEAADILDRSGTRVLFAVGEFLGSYFPDLL